MNKVSFDALPAGLASVIDKQSFVRGFYRPDRSRYVIRQLLPDGRNEELEYDEKLGRMLTVAERTAELPPALRDHFVDEDVSVASTQFIDQATSQLRCRFEAFDKSGQRLVSSVRLVNDDFPWDAHAVVQEALEKRRWPSQYATWPREDRVAYWVRTIHHWRRTTGESGRNEDEIYTPKLVEDIEQVEPGLRGMLAEILTEVGWLEQTKADEAIAAFTSGTGVAVTRP